MRARIGKSIGVAVSVTVLGAVLAATGGSTQAMGSEALTRQPAAAPADVVVTVHLHKGPAGSSVRIKGSGFIGDARCDFLIGFAQEEGSWQLKSMHGTSLPFKIKRKIPPDAAVGPGVISIMEIAYGGEGVCRFFGQIGFGSFRVTH